MASAKDIKKKIRSVSNTKKITRTMEMVATVKSKRGQDRIKATTPYTEKLAEVIHDMAGSGSIEHPLLEGARRGAAAAEPGARGFWAALRSGSSRGASRDEDRSGTGARGSEPSRESRTLVIVVTGNRGLCGGYNSNTLALAEMTLADEARAGRATETWMIGKKGISRFRFRKHPVAKGITHLGDIPEVGDVDKLADEFLPRYLRGELDRVLVVATRYFSSSTQRPVATALLPLSLQTPPLLPRLDGADARDAGEPAPGAEALDFIFEPDRGTVLQALMPMVVRNALYRILLEARASEQIARRIAMKMATDNADTMIRTYTQAYNRQRQTGITQQIMEIVGGAEALQ